MEKPLNIAIAGAGSIGCFVGGLLHHSGHKVSFLARERMKSRLEKDGINLTSFDGVEMYIFRLPHWIFKLMLPFWVQRTSFWSV